ncbi:MAG: insulinase family protein [Helicobacteraceae bacterium]|jgi:predicted Zn-dependent peptidase|nr:insulinase family protein [Helicobacteraceae bacterium]
MVRFCAVLLLLQGFALAMNIEYIENVPLLYEEDHKLPIVSLQIVFSGSGSISDGNNLGAAYLTSALLREGSKKLGSVAFARALEEKAINLDFHAGKENFSISISSLKEQFDDGVDLLIAVLQDPNLTKDALKKIKIIAQGEFGSLENNFDYVADRGLNEILFKNTPLMRPVMSDPKSVEKISLNTIGAHIKTALVKERVTLLFGGDLSDQEAKKWSKKILNALPNGKTIALDFYEAQGDEQTQTIERETEQAYIYFGAPFNLRYDDEEGYKATAASFILGASGFGSRLMEEIRVKRGLAYGAYSYVNLSLASSGFSGHLQTKIESQEEAIKLVKEVISGFVKNGATQKELDEARKFILGSEPLRNETMSQRLHRTYGDFYRKKPIGWQKEQLKKIEKLTLKELNEFIAAHPEILRLSFFIVTQTRQAD